MEQTYPQYVQNTEIIPAIYIRESLQCPESLSQNMINFWINSSIETKTYTYLFAQNLWYNQLIRLTNISSIVYIPI